MKFGNTASRPTLVVAVALLSIVWLAIGAVFPREDHYTVLQVAAQLSAGQGSTFGTLDPATPAFPLASLPFALLPLPREPMMVSGLALIVGLLSAGLLTRLCGTVWAAVACLLFFSVQQSLPVLLMLALALAAVELALRQNRWWVSGLCVGAALLADPAAAWLAALLMVVAVQRGAWRVLKIAAPVAIGGGWLISGAITSGSLPVSLTQPVPLVALIGLAGMAAFRLYPTFARQASPHLSASLLLAAWSALLMLMQPGTIHAAAASGLIALAAQLRPRWVVAAAAVADVLLAVGLGLPLAPPDARIVGQWIAANTGPDTVIATDQGSPFAFYAQRPLIDLSGQWQPLDNRALSDPAFFVRHAPDALVVREGSAVGWDGFATTYANTFRQGALSVYQRVVNFTPLTPHEVNVPFTFIGRDDIRLIGVAAAAQPSPGDLLRIRLSWNMRYAPRDVSLEVRVTLTSAEGTLLADTRQAYPATFWSGQHVDTFHLIAVGREFPKGEAQLTVAIAARGGVFAPCPAARVLIR